MAQKATSNPPPSYNQAIHGESSHASPQEPSGVYGPGLRGPDLTYLKSVGGIVKIVEAVSMILFGKTYHLTTNEMICRNAWHSVPTMFCFVTKT